MHQPFVTTAPAPTGICPAVRGYFYGQSPARILAGKGPTFDFFNTMILIMQDKK